MICRTETNKSSVYEPPPVLTGQAGVRRILHISDLNKISARSAKSYRLALSSAKSRALDLLTREINAPSR